MSSTPNQVMTSIVQVHRAVVLERAFENLLHILVPVEFVLPPLWSVQANAGNHP